MSSSKGNHSSAESTSSSSASTGKPPGNRDLTYNTVTHKFAYVSLTELHEYPRSQVQEVEVGRFCNGVSFELSSSNGMPALKTMLRGLEVKGY